MSIVELALSRPYTFIVMAMLILLATPFVLRNMATDIFPEIDIPVITHHLELQRPDGAGDGPAHRRRRASAA